MKIEFLEEDEPSNPFAGRTDQVLLDALREIVEVASGERQVAMDDTAGMAWIGKRARVALKGVIEAVGEDQIYEICSVCRREQIGKRHKHPCE